MMRQAYEKKLQTYLADYGVAGEHLLFSESCHTVEEAAQAASADVEDLVKNICMIDGRGRLIVAIVKGEDRVSTSRVARVLNIKKPRIANPDEILNQTGYPCGGTPSFGFEAIFLVDPKVLERDVILSGGGSDRSLVRINPDQLVTANNGTVVRIRR